MPFGCLRMFESNASMQYCCICIMRIWLDLLSCYSKKGKSKPCATFWHHGIIARRWHQQCNQPPVVQLCSACSAFINGLLPALPINRKRVKTHDLTGKQLMRCSLQSTASNPTSACSCLWQEAEANCYRAAECCP